MMRCHNEVVRQVSPAANARWGMRSRAVSRLFWWTGMPICWKVCRYVELNPVRARMVSGPGEWPWSSYRVHVGEAARPP